MSSRFVSRFLVCALVCLIWNGGAEGADWKKIDALIEGGEFAAAKNELGKILKERKSDRDLASATIKMAEVLDTEDKYEEAVTFLETSERPKGAAEKALVELYTAKAIFSYAVMNSWEISQREQTLSTAPKPLRSMTRSELYAAALGAYNKAWTARSDLEKQKISDYKSIIQPNTFPNGLRGTLRDAVAYKAVEALENSSYWSPAESNSLYTLSLNKILAGDLKDLGIKGDISLADPQYHPALKMAYVLDDLARWNSDKGNDNGALEARISLHKSLYDLLQSDDEKKTVRESLTKILDERRKLSWAASGYGLLASFYLANDEPVSAHKIAAQCITTYKVNTEFCASIKDMIEQPNLQVFSMNIDGANKRSFLVQHKNLQTVWFRAYKLDLAGRSGEHSTQSLIPESDEYEKLRKKKADFSWQVQLPTTADFRQHDTYVTPPFKEPGLYAVMSSAKEDFGSKDNIVSAFSFTISNLVILTEATFGKPGETLVTVVNGESGKPVANATVTIFNHTPYNEKDVRKKIADGVTDANGRVTLKGMQRRNSLYLIAKKGKEISLRTDPETGYSTGRQQQKQSLVYTDRGAYRPGQKIQWKVIAFTRSQGQSDLSVTPNQKFTVSLHDVNSNKVRTKEVTSNAFGSASGEFVIPEGRPLGQWYLSSSHGYGSHQISVEEYKRPTFEVTFKEPSEQYRVNQPAEVSGEARYHFGAPLTEGKVAYRVERQPRYPSWMSFIFWRQQPSTRTEMVASGEVKISPDGTFKIVFTPKAKEASTPFEMTTAYSYNISADVTDNGGETRSQSTRLIAGHLTVQADLSEVRTVCFNPADCTMRISRQTLNGSGSEGLGQAELIALIPPNSTVAPADVPLEAPTQENESAEKHTPTPGDLMRPRWHANVSLESYLSSWKPGSSVAKHQIKHEKNGQGSFKAGNLEAGAYKLVYTTKDAGGREYKIWKYFVVAKSGNTSLKLPLILAADVDTQEVGKVARLFVNNGTKTPQFLRLYRQNRHLREIKIAPGSHIIEVPVTADLRGGFTAVLHGIFDYQSIRLTENVFVPWSDKNLEVSFERIRDIMRPGTKESFTIRVKGANASDRVAEVLAFMYDKSLDAIQPNQVQVPLSLFPNTVGAPHVGTNLWEVGGIHLDAEGFSYASDFSLPVTDALSGREERSAGVNLKRLGLGVGKVMRKKSRGAAADYEGAAMDMEAAGGNESVMALAESAPAQSTSAAPELQKKAPSTATRENFAETAFFIPHLTTKADGTVSATFTLPDSLTAWHVRAVALMKNFSSGTADREVRTAKDLMTRLYVPRFVREGDEITVRTTLNNMSKSQLNGPIKVSIRDADTNADLGKLFDLRLDQSKFTLPGGGSTAVSATIKIPPGIRTVKVEAQASAGSFSDAEVRTIPVLPGRMHLIQSRFTALQPGGQETVTFDDLKDTSDKTRINEKMVVTVDAQLFFSTLKAVPYLVSYPYECSEQTLNRFLSAGIMSSMFEANPDLKKAAASFATRDRQYEPWAKNDPNQRMQLEESPWLQDASGGKSSDDAALINLLRPETADSIRKKALADLKKMQTASGGFPWFAGGAPSPYMTLYIVYGFAKAQEFDIKIPEDMVSGAWRYLADYYKTLWVKKDLEKGLHAEFLTFLNFTASAFAKKSVFSEHFKQQDRKRILEYSLKHWKKMSPYMQLMLSLTAHRMEDKENANLVLNSILGRAKTTKEGGTSWSMEDRSWLWYNDSTEMHAFALRVLSEMRKDSNLIPGIIHWIFLDKKLNQWKSTKATAEVIYSVATHLRTTGTIATDDRIDVILGPIQKSFNFRKDEYTGRQFLTVKGSDVSAAKASVTAKSHAKSLAFVSTTWHYSTESLPKDSRGDFFAIERKYFLRKAGSGAMTLKPLGANESIAIGDELEVQISIRTKHQAEYVHLRDPRPSGFEPVSVNSGYKWDLGISWYEEIRDNGTNFFFDWLPTGEYTFKYRLRAANAGSFKSMPAEIQSLYAPEFNAFSAGQTMTIAN